ncbi:MULTISPECIES: MFS transporter [unclassified Streptomyces]|uniref:MFS transporter n=1 Tax=Streptomyces TaxID=1883 RepID=UPI0005161E0D|nr:MULTISPECIES: MFS transporter [unclassified Streptomyces]MYW99833.1 MFS transporter [Streptomyces sp. SID8378]PVC99601.1 MFS transporter [Streptomyces sp. CS147]SNB89799.1 Predicted arabinose efflux permease, MFS family [Streptomyces sp. PgraA7]
MKDIHTPDSDKRILRTLITSSALSKVADWQLGIVIPLTVLAESDSVALSLAVFALRGVSYVVSPFVGAIIDRFDKRTVLVLALLQQAACLALLPVSLSSPPAVALIVLLSGMGSVACIITGHFVTIPRLISPPARSVAVGKLNSAMEFSKVVGILLGGAGFTAFGPAIASLCIAALYVLAGIVALALPRMPSTQTEMNLRHDLAVGFRWVGRREILWLVVTMSITNVAIGQLEPALVTEFSSGGINPTVISVLMALGLLTGAVASRFASSFLPSLSWERRILASQIMAFTGLVCIAVPVLPVRIMGFMVECFAIAVTNVASIVYRQETIPPDLAGRVNATIRMFITGSVPLSGFLYAWASRFDGYRSWLPSLVLWVISIGIWAVHTRYGARVTAMPPAGGVAPSAEPEPQPRQELRDGDR